MSEHQEGDSIIPIEINTHFHLFKKQIWEMSWVYKCDICNSTVDELGFCGCGAGTE